MKRYFALSFKSGQWPSEIFSSAAPFALYCRDCRAAEALPKDPPKAPEPLEDIAKVPEPSTSIDNNAGPSHMAAEEPKPSRSFEEEPGPSANTAEGIPKDVKDYFDLSDEEGPSKEELERQKELKRQRKMMRPPKHKKQHDGTFKIVRR